MALLGDVVVIYGSGAFTKTLLISVKNRLWENHKKMLSRSIFSENSVLKLNIPGKNG